MKKYIISTSIIVASIAAVSALDEVGVTVNQNAAVSVQARPAAMIQPAVQTITTGDAAVDAKVKALQLEFETKMKALREEYQAKIKAVIGDRKVTGGGTMMATGSARMMEGRPGMGQGQGQGEVGARASASSSGRVMMQNGQPMGKGVRGEATASAEVSANASGETGGLRGFFMRLFGR